MGSWPGGSRRAPLNGEALGHRAVCTQVSAETHAWGWPCWMPATADPDTTAGREAARWKNGDNWTLVQTAFKEVTWKNDVPTPAPAKLLALHARGKPSPGTLGRGQDSRNSLSKDRTQGRGGLEPECSALSQCPLRAGVSLPCRAALSGTQRDLQASSDCSNDPGSCHPAVA